MTKEKRPLISGKKVYERYGISSIRAKELHDWIYQNEEKPKTFMEFVRNYKDMYVYRTKNTMTKKQWRNLYVFITQNHNLPLYKQCWRTNKDVLSKLNEYERCKKDINDTILLKEQEALKKNKIESEHLSGQIEYTQKRIKEKEINNQKQHEMVISYQRFWGVAQQPVDFSITLYDRQGNAKEQRVQGIAYQCWVKALFERSIKEIYGSSKGEFTDKLIKILQEPSQAINFLMQNNIANIEEAKNNIAMPSLNEFLSGMKNV